jgi:PAB-dependent poly(A)-specific ribonuclease subunit 2
VTSVSISATAAYMGFGDAEGIIHLLSLAENGTALPFNGFDDHPVEWADNPLPLSHIEWTNTT